MLKSFCGVHSHFPSHWAKSLLHELSYYALMTQVCMVAFGRLQWIAIT
jgi:hypothetical protein